MIYLGSALMVYNIARYAGFIKKMRWIDKSPRVHRALYLPITLLIAFLAGYLAVAWFGKPDLIVASILLGGSAHHRHDGQRVRGGRGSGAGRRDGRPHFQAFEPAGHVPHAG